MLKKIDYRNILGVLSVFALVVSVSAYVLAGGNSINVSGDYNDYGGQAQGDGSFGAYITDPTRFTDVNITNDLVVDGLSTFTSGTTLTGTTTQKLVDLASPYSFNLTLSATSTSPSGAGSVTFANDGFCHIAALDISKGGAAAGGRLGTGAPFSISMSTTTAAGIGFGANILATSTIPTSTATYFDTVAQPGTGIGPAGRGFLVKTGEVLQVSFNGTTGDPATSTDSITGMTGKVLVLCVTRW